MSLKTTVQKGSDGRFQTTVPKRLGTKYDLGGQPVAYRVESRDRVSVLLDPSDDDKTTTIHKTSNDQFKLNLPTGLADAMRLDGATINWDETDSLTRITFKAVQRRDNDE